MRAVALSEYGGLAAAVATQDLVAGGRVRGRVVLELGP